ncbi:type I-E CRISPR-associated protein Cse2/CasB [Leptothrix ochracea]|uniref:type I-E CRISPR-associated protein Cse2/CasB n=1 Tax=Leptothrix ochracea TaxID=735331 RepID=UPI0034E1B09A
MSAPLDFYSHFVDHLAALSQRDRGALAVLRRSLSFSPGAYPPAYPYVERFIPPQSGDQDALRQALYLVAGLYANHPQHQSGTSLARSFGLLMLDRQSPSIEKRFIALLSTDADGLPELLRQVISLLAADGRSLDYTALLKDLVSWLQPWAFETRDRMRQGWARDFYRSAPNDTTILASTSEATAA